MTEYVLYTSSLLNVVISYLLFSLNRCVRYPVLLSGYQCLPGAHASPGAVPGEEGGEAGHQSLLHGQHHPGGLQDPPRKPAGLPRSRVQNSHGRMLTLHYGAGWSKC